MMRIVLVADTAILAPNFASTALNAAQAWIVESLGWFYMLLVGILAIALLLAGGLEALQAAALTTALPFGIVMLFMCVATLRSLRVDLARYDRAASRAQYEEVTEQLAENFDETLGEQVDSRVDNRIDYRLARTRAVFNRQAVKEDIRQDVSGRHRRRRERGER